MACFHASESKIIAMKKQSLTSQSQAQMNVICVPYHLKIISSFVFTFFFLPSFSTRHCEVCSNRKLIKLIYLAWPRMCCFTTK